MTVELELKSKINQLTKNVYIQIILLVLLIFVLFGLILFLLFNFSVWKIILILLITFLIIFLIISLVQKRRLLHLLVLLEKLLIHNFYIRAYYFIKLISNHYAIVEELLDDVAKLANISFIDDWQENNSLYDKELDKIISIIDFNIDIYKDFYLHNKQVYEQYQKQLENLEESLSEVDEIYESHKKNLELEKYRLMAYRKIKNYFQDLKKKQIKKEFEIPEILVLKQNEIKFVDEILEQAIALAGSHIVLDEIYRAKNRFYEVFSDILKAKSIEQIEKKLHYLFSS